MRVNMKINGDLDTINWLTEQSGVARKARDRALRETGNLVRREVKRERRAVKPLGDISKKLKRLDGQARPQPWGKSRFTVHVFRRTGTVRVSTQGANRIMEEGGFVTISDKFKKFLHTQGKHLKASTTQVRVPPRPIFARAFNRLQGKISARFATRFHHHYQYYLSRLK